MSNTSVDDTMWSNNNVMKEQQQQQQQKLSSKRRVGGPRKRLQHALSAGAAVGTLVRNNNNNDSNKNEEQRVKNNNALHNAVGSWIQKRGGIRRRQSSGALPAAISFDKDDGTESSTLSSSQQQQQQLEEELEVHQPLTPKKNGILPSSLKHTERIPLRRTLDPDNVESLPDAMLVWLQAVQQLLQSPEMGRVVHSSAAVAQQAGGLVLQTATFPVRLSWNCTATVIGRSSHLVVSTTSSLLGQHSYQSEHQATGEGSEEQHHGLLHNVIALPSAIIGLAGKIVVSVVAPVLQQNGDQNNDNEYEYEGKSWEGAQANVRYGSPPRSQKKLDRQPTIPVTESPRFKGGDDTFLERLRLDFVPQDDDLAMISAKKELFPIETSRFLLRVNDLGLKTESGKPIHYIDLTAKCVDMTLITEAFDQLCNVALCMLANHLLVRIHDPAYEVNPQTEIHWQAEGSTKKILRKMSEQSEPGRVQTLLSETCIWSGRFVQQRIGDGRNFGFFLARGAIRMDPHELLCLLWDNSRTGEYNQYCLGRSTVQVLLGSDETVLNGNGDDEKASVAAKIIRSTMRVPFAGITVKAICLMHVRPLPEGGYVILSRTLDTGTSGTHFSEKNVDESSKKNEILWGVNIIRPVQPGVSDLTSLSQVGSSVPNFLAQKIGMMGITDFFKNVRAIANDKKEA